MGVKSLWQLLAPVGRPVQLENMEGKSMAIDSSIWIYQFQATMRDKEGRVLVNAHVLGFLRRICKLLFFGIKPVFVFDGGAPTLKRMTITERKKKKSGAAESHAKLAERLLAAQMRREAVAQAQRASDSVPQGRNEVPRGHAVIEEDTVFLEDIENPSSTPQRDNQKGKGKASPNSVSPSKKKAKWHDHDPYRLPAVDMEAAIAKATSSRAPDPRLATEDELRAFIEQMKPEDLDVTSPEFRELPTEVQYEIIGDLRLKSRQTSHKRLQSMLQSSKTPLDFSKAQIQLLKQRNNLTQQLLETTDSIGQANVTIPIRIASERNREYVLIKNESEAGGWVLGIRDEGTQSKPIEIDVGPEETLEDEGGSDDDEMEEVNIPDPDLREYQRKNALKALAHRSVSDKPKRPKKPKATPLFVPDEDEPSHLHNLVDESSGESDMELAMEASLAQQEYDELQRAIKASKEGLPKGPGPPLATNVTSEESGDDLYLETPSRLDTALAFANTRRSDENYAHLSSSGSKGKSSIFGRATLLTSPTPAPKELLEPLSVDISDEEDDMEEIVPQALDADLAPVDDMYVEDTHTDKPVESIDLEEAREDHLPPSPSHAPALGSDIVGAISSTDSLLTGPLNLETVLDTTHDHLHSETMSSVRAAKVQPEPEVRVTPAVEGDAALLTDAMVPGIDSDDDLELVDIRSQSASPGPDKPAVTEVSMSLKPRSVSSSPSAGEAGPAPTVAQTLNDENEEFFSDWSRSPSPEPGPSGHDTAPPATRDDHWDAAQEMNPHEEEGDFARFMSQVKGKNLDDVRREIDEEISVLNQQKKAAMRDSEDVNQQMINQIMVMLRLFGIPYITAPMEAEAQCAELVSLGLVDGIITDDSDVFLFGGLRVFKNMFNQSKTVECFHLTDLARELGLERSKLVRLAYLLGSDYVEGLPGVGPVVAMELLAEFPGEDGLHKFKDWWLKVQSGRDSEKESGTKFRWRFKKRFKELYLTTNWPNPAVRDAYYHPTVDKSDEPFKWGLPDLDGLRHFFQEELSWNGTKVDQLLLPIIQKMNKRRENNALNKQDNLNVFFDISAGAGAIEPRNRQAYTSKRLQQLVSDHRKRQAGESRDSTPGASSSSSDANTSSTQAKKRKAKGKADDVSPAKRGRGAASGRAGGRGRARGRARGSGRGKATTESNRDETPPNEDDSDDSLDDFGDQEQGPIPDKPLAVQLRPRVRPRPAYKGTAGADNGEEGSDDT